VKRKTKRQGWIFLEKDFKRGVRSNKEGKLFALPKEKDEKAIRLFLK
jgi:hypothetical protein